MITKFNFNDSKLIIKMSEMKNLNMATIVGDQNGLPNIYTGESILRTANNENKEFMFITNPGCEKYFSAKTELTVRLFKPGESVTLIQE